MPNKHAHRLSLCIVSKMAVPAITLSDECHYVRATLRLLFLAAINGSDFEKIANI